MKKYLRSTWLIIFFFFSSLFVFSQNEYAIDLDGSESCFVNDDNSNHLDISGAYTFECWIYVRTYQNLDRIMDRRHVLAWDLIAAKGSGDFGINFNKRKSNDDVYLQIETNEASEDLYLNTWYHIAVTFDGDSCKLWVDDQMVGLYVKTSWNLSGSINALNIGGRHWSSYGYQIDAIIDEVRVSDVARDISDMQTDSHWEEYTSDAHTVLLMHFDDQAVGPTYDSGTGLSGTTGGDDFDSTDYSSSNIDAPDFILQPKYRSKATGNWADSTSWEVEQGAANYVDATHVPSQYSESIDILSSHSIGIALGNSFTAHDLNINAGGTLNQSGNLSVYGDLSNSSSASNLKLHANSSGAASLITYGNITGNAQMECYFPTLNQWYLIASPMSNSTAAVYNGQYLDYWNEEDGIWVGIENPSTSLSPMQGYSVKKNLDSTATYEGSFNTGSQSFTLSYHANGATFGDGWNLIGNPYPSSIDWNEVTIPSGMNAGVSLWKNVAGNKRKYVVWNDGVGNDSARYISPGQGMMVQATADGTVLNFSNSIRTHTNASGFEKDTKAKHDTIPDVLQITARANGSYDDTYIRFKADAGIAFNGEYEVHKLLTNEVTIPQIFSWSAEEKLAINAIPPPVNEEVVHLGMIMGVNGRTSLKFSGQDTFDDNQGFFLLDKVNGQIYDLREQNTLAFDYHTTDDSNRFDLIFGLLTQSEESESSAPQPLVYAYGNRLFISSSSKEMLWTQIAIYNIMGQQVWTGKINHTFITGKDFHLPTAYYLVRLYGDGIQYSKKVYFSDE